MACNSVAERFDQLVKHTDNVWLVEALVYKWNRCTGCQQLMTSSTARSSRIECSLMRGRGQEQEFYTHSQPLTNPIGASKCSNALRPTSPARLLPTEPDLPASWTITILPVDFTISLIACDGSGLMVLRSTS